MNSSADNDNTFLSRLNSVVEANLADENFGVSELAGELKISRSNLYLKIKSATGKSTSQFIRKARLNKALELLKQTDMNVSEIAYKVGFGSPTYFNSCFHEYFGYSPGETKKHIIKESSSTDDFESDYKMEIPEKPKYQKKRVFAFALLIILPGMYFLFFMNSSGKKAINVSEKSIIVLPFKNLSTDESNQYFADGISEDILNQLTKIADLKVVSRTSADQFRESSLSANQIAKKIDVRYLLGGSVRRQGDNIRLCVQLIDAKNDRTLWSENYDRKLADIFIIQSDIAQNVTNQLQLILSPERIEHFEKLKTKNAEAYDLYLQGRFYHRIRTKGSFEKSLYYHNKALELDSNYCLPYAGLADVYLTSTWFGNYTKEEGIAKSRACALKALSIDRNLAEAHATLGGIATYFDYDWETAEKELKLAMKLNPQYSRAYHLYSQYLTVIRKEDEAHLYIDKALDLNQSDRQLNWHKYYLYNREENYDKALEFSEKVFFIDGNKEDYLYRKFLICLMQNNISEAIEAFKNICSIVSPEISSEIVDNIYAEEGMTGFINFVVDCKLEHVEPFLYRTAALYSIINEKDSALTYLEQAYECGSGGVVRAVGGREFDNLYSEPRFKELLRKMNLTPYFPEIFEFR